MQVWRGPSALYGLRRHHSLPSPHAAAGRWSTVVRSLGQGLGFISATSRRFLAGLAAASPWPRPNSRVLLGNRLPKQLPWIRIRSIQASSRSHRLPTSHRPPIENAESFVPTRKQLLSAVPNFWPRFRLRLRLFLMGRIRPWKMDDILAMFSWIFVGNTVFILAGTTTFVSLFVFAINSLQFQEYFAKKISDYLTHETGFNITFESAIAPNWRDGTLGLKNVEVLCTGDSYLGLVNSQRKEKGLGPITRDEMDLNWTYWDLTIRSVDVTLSLWRLIEGRGLVKECTMKGVRGVVDRRHIWWDPNWVPSCREPQPNDFELDKFVIEDLLVTVHNPNFRPYQISVFNAELPLFRKQWLLYDMFCADSIVGTFDNCLFSVHKPQQHDVPEEDERGVKWAKMSHLKMNGLPIAHMNMGATGPFGWITNGTVDIDLHILIPQLLEDDIVELIQEEINEIKSLTIDKIEEAILVYPHEREEDLLIRRGLVQQSAPQPKQSPAMEEPAEPPSMLMFWEVKLNDLKASVPLSSPHISYMNNALIRPIVAYMNNNRTTVPIAFSAKMDLTKFDGAWDVYAAGMVDVLAEEVGKAFTALVENEHERSRRIRQVGLWSIQSVTKNLMTVMDYARGMKGWSDYSNTNPWYAGNPVRYL
ncbi:mitochondrial distribution and morphology proteins-domain-containing protein [Polychytrium aggregatum]|uniref:mitochondrial distribution and morphology proteins-domain-containing protein n=1 Tax=Polychytrium aggregatum TaxID=110093 RepID=UPI0022FE43FD|nr:mitochondrial distribution and morphology proteins-domain-containing protein [Polychytrium aggregatum]KAI9199384.1 mitochondrial distribution and morphology proteins-domain-containing protein [Polychytrium aggregatum]